MGKNFSKVIAAKHLFDGVRDDSYEGYICLKDNVIVKAGTGAPPQEITDQAEEFLQFDEELVMPGITDTHTFFTGYAVFHVGADMSDVTDSEQGLKALQKYECGRSAEGAIFGHGWDPEKWSQAEGEKMLETEYSDRAVILFAADRSTCIMNRKARELYGFTRRAVILKVITVL